MREFALPRRPKVRHRNIVSSAVEVYSAALQERNRDEIYRSVSGCREGQSKCAVDRVGGIDRQVAVVDFERQNRQGGIQEPAAAVVVVVLEIPTAVFVPLVALGCD